MLIMHVGFLACFHAISLECSRFSKNRHVIFLALVALKLLVLRISRLVERRQTHRTTTVTLAAHARRGWIASDTHHEMSSLLVVVKSHLFPQFVRLN